MKNRQLHNGIFMLLLCLFCLLFLLSYGESKEYIVNGKFEEPDVGDDSQVGKPIKGWRKRVEIGRGFNYNRAWKSQVVELDVEKN